MELTKGLLAKMKYVVQCYISDKTGQSIKIADFTSDQLNAAYAKACQFYGDLMPRPDSGRYEDYSL